MTYFTRITTELSMMKLAGGLGLPKSVDRRFTVSLAPLQTGVPQVSRFSRPGPCRLPTPYASMLPSSHPVGGILNEMAIPRQYDLVRGRE